MDVLDLKQQRHRVRQELRRAAWERIGPDQVLDLEHLVVVMADPFGTHRARLIGRRWIAAGMSAAGATAAQIGAALDVDPAALAEWIGAKLFADPAIAAAIDRQVVETLPDSLVTFPALYGPALELEKAKAAAQLR